MSIDLGTIYSTIYSTLVAGEIRSVFRVVGGGARVLSTVVTSFYSIPEKPREEAKAVSEYEERIRRLARRGVPV